MSKRTKKVGAMGRYGPRYGVRDRVKIRDVERRQKAAHTCPNCARPTVSRRDTGIWACSKCGTTFVGGAYIPRTDAGLSVDKAIQGVIDRLRSGQATEEEA